MKAALIVAASALLLAGASGFLTSQALGTAASQATRTETITIRNGPTGPAGPAGPRGPTGASGASSCPLGFEPGELVINHPGGQVTLFSCLKRR